MSTRTLAAICADARQAPCPHCESAAGEPCWPDPGCHLARVAGAYQAGFITGPDFLSVTDATTVFMWATTIPDTGTEAA